MSLSATMVTVRYFILDHVAVRTYSLDLVCNPGDDIFERGYSVLQEEMLLDLGESFHSITYDPFSDQPPTSVNQVISAYQRYTIVKVIIMSV